MKGETYEQFTEKFKPKKTTDDCYTPPEIYETAKDWAVKHYEWQGRPIVRPFWPGGDYENFDYPENCVGIDNPPFSIISKIVNFYEANKIDYFLFAPSLTIVSIKNATSHICLGVDVTYENKAKIGTSFVASKGPAYLSEPELYKTIKEANRKCWEHTVKKTKHYKYPCNVMKGTDFNALSNLGIWYSTNNFQRITRLFSDTGEKVEIFGGGILIDEKEGEILRNKINYARRQKILNKKVEPEGIELHL